MRPSTWIPLSVAAFAAALGGLIELRQGPPPTPAPAPSASAALPAASDAGMPAAGMPGMPAAEVTPEETRLEDDESFRLLVFPVPLDGARFRVVDLGMKRDLDRVLAETSASIVINGGFFDLREQPEGLVVSEGVRLSPLSDTLGGGVIRVAGDRASLAAAKGFTVAPGTDFAIQARPRLVVDGASVIAKDDGRAAERTALCLREQGRTLEVIVARGEVAGRGPTLALLADMLVSRGCLDALNLDGGPSTGVAWRAAGEAHSLAPRGPVRHAIAIWAPSDEPSEPH